MMQIRRSLCTLIKNKLKEESNFKPRYKFISQIPLQDLENSDYENAMRHSLKYRPNGENLDKVKTQYEMLLELEKLKSQLEKAKADVNLKYNQAKSDEMKEKLKYDGQIIREDIRSLKEVLSSLREDVNFIAQTLPNLLHERVPLDHEKEIIHEVETEVRSLHGRNDYPKFPHCTYSTEKHAWIDLLLPIKALKYLKENKFIQSSNPDFLKQFVARAGGVQNSDYCRIHEEDVQMDDQNLMLVGSGSFSSFLPYITRLSVHPSALPLRLAAIGREYSSFNQDNSLVPSQAQTVQLFLATKEKNDSEMELDQLLTLYKTYYETFEQGFRISYVPAKDLHPAESLRIDIELESAFTNEYVKVADIRLFGDYISKRLLFNYRVEKHYDFPHVIGGTFLHIPQILSAVDADRINIEEFFE